MWYISRGFNDTFVITDENGKILTAHDIEGVIKVLKAKKKDTEFLDYVTKRQKEKKRNVKTWYGKRIH